MGQPTPPGDSPLYEGLGSEWNDVISAWPEEQRATLAPKLKERIDAYEPLKQWDTFQKSGITPEHVGTALDLFSVIENNPREVYDTLAKHLNITPAQAKEVVKEVQAGNNSENETNPEIATLKQQVETMAQILMAQRQQSSQAQLAAEAETAIENEIKAVKKKYGDSVDEEEIIMRMLHQNMTAEQAHQAYTNKVTEIQKRRPAPFVMGAGGNIPSNSIDVKKLSGQDTKSLVAQMMSQANAERNQ